MSSHEGKTHAEQAHAKKMVAAMAILYFAVASSATQYSNKALFTTFGFGFPLIVAMAQTLFMIPTCFLSGRPKLDVSIAMGVAPIAICNMLNMIFGLMGTAGLSVPMFICLRRFVFFFTISIERFIYGKSHDRQTLWSVFVMIFGSVIAATTDPTFNLYGYVSVLLNDLFTSLYLILVKNNKAAKSLSPTELLFYNSMLNLPMLAALAWYSGEWAGALRYPNQDTTAFRVTLAASCMLGLAVNHSTFVCTRATSPLTTSVTGSFKNVLMTLIGMVAFGDFQFKLANLVGLTVSMIGGIWYATYQSLKGSKGNGAAAMDGKDHKLPLSTADLSRTTNTMGSSSLNLLTSGDTTQDVARRK